MSPIENCTYAARCDYTAVSLDGWDAEAAADGW